MFHIINNNNNNQILEVDGWVSDVYGFLRETKPSGLNLWVTFLTDDKFVLPNDTNDETHCRLPDIGEDGQKEDTETEEEEHYNPYIRLYSDCEDWGYGDGMPDAWRQ